MAAEVRQFYATIPAGTPSSAPVRVDLSFPARVVQSIQVRVPPGPSGQVGFAIQNSGLTVIPYQSARFIVTSDEVIDWPLDGFIDSGSWQLIGYNTGIYAHTIGVRFLLALITSKVPPVPAVPNLIGMSSAAPLTPAQQAAMNAAEDQAVA